MRRLLPKLMFVAALAFLPFASGARAQAISVSLPELTATNVTETIPLSVGDLSGQNVKAYALTISYDPNVLRILDAQSAGTLSEGFLVTPNATEPGQFTVAAAHSQAIEGGGTLLTLEVELLGPGSTALQFSNFTFNEGMPEATPTNGTITNASPTDTEDIDGIPTEFRLEGNFPNPFNPTTSVQFNLPEPAEVRIEVMDILGRRVMDLPAERLQAGANHSIQIDASSLASGVYLYRVIAQGAQKTHVESATMTLIK